MLEAVGEGVDLGVREEVGVGELDGVTVPVTLGVVLPESEVLGVLLGEAPGDSEVVALPDTVGSAESVEDGVREGVWVGDVEREGVAVGDGVGEDVAVGVPVGEGVPVPVEVSELD